MLKDVRSKGFEHFELMFLFLFQVLVLGNKRDISGALDEKELIERM